MFRVQTDTSEKVRQGTVLCLFYKTENRPLSYGESLAIPNLNSILLLYLLRSKRLPARRTSGVFFGCFAS